jgi:tetratricopeptide (TPR) repeat protein
MRCLIFVGVLALAPMAHAWQSDNEPMPPACRQNARGVVDYAACAAAAEEGSALWRLSQINLGTLAFRDQDYTTAAQHYDAADPPGGDRLYSDASYHAFRAAVLAHVGRNEEAAEEARISIAVMDGDDSIPEYARERFTPETVDVEQVYVAILPILKRADSPSYARILAAYRAVPVDGWISWANRAAVFDELGAHDEALAASVQALSFQPDHPALLNNHCYILTNAGRAREGLAYCERAVSTAPDIGAFRHSYAVALAGAGECVRAREELERASLLDPSAAAYREPIACTPA